MKCHLWKQVMLIRQPRVPTPYCCYTLAQYMKACMFPFIHPAISHSYIKILSNPPYDFTEKFESKAKQKSKLLHAACNTF